MIRNLKAMGLMAVAALALSAMFATAAQATPNGVFTSGLTPSTHTASLLTGTQYGGSINNYWETAGGTKYNCLDSGVTFHGNTTGTDTELKITPTYKDCTISGLPATPTMNGCTYNFDRPTHLSNHTTWTSTVDLNCPAGKVVEHHVYLGGTMTAHNTPICTITVLPANNLGHVEFHNQPAGGTTKDDLTATIDLGNVPVEEHGAACPDGNTVKTTTTYKSTVTVKGQNAVGAQHDVWISTGSTP